MDIFPMNVPPDSSIPEEVQIEKIRSKPGVVNIYQNSVSFSKESLQSLKEKTTSSNAVNAKFHCKDPASFNKNSTREILNFIMDYKFFTALHFVNYNFAAEEIKTLIEYIKNQPDFVVLKIETISPKTFVDIDLLIELLEKLIDEHPSLVAVKIICASSGKTSSKSIKQSERIEKINERGGNKWVHYRLASWYKEILGLFAEAKTATEIYPPTTVNGWLMRAYRKYVAFSNVLNDVFGNSEGTYTEYFYSPEEWQHNLSDQFSFNIPAQFRLTLLQVYLDKSLFEEAIDFIKTNRDFTEFEKALGYFYIGEALLGTRVENPIREKMIMIGVCFASALNFYYPLPRPSYEERYAETLANIFRLNPRLVSQAIGKSTDTPVVDILRNPNDKLAVYRFYYLVVQEIKLQQFPAMTVEASALAIENNEPNVNDLLKLVVVDPEKIYVTLIQLQTTEIAKLQSEKIYLTAQVNRLEKHAEESAEPPTKKRRRASFDF